MEVQKRRGKNIEKKLEKIKMGGERKKWWRKGECE